MKTTIINTIILIFLFSCNSNNVSRENDLKDLGLKGSVKSIVEIEYNVEEKFGEIHLKNENWKKELYFNEEGYIKKSKSSGFSDGSGSVLLYKYDQGNLIEVAEYYLDGSLRWKDVSKYDKNHKKIEINEYNADEDLSSKIKFKYNENGVKLEANKYDSDGKLGSTTKYDHRDNTTEYLGYDSNSILIYHKKYLFDEQNHLLETEIYSAYTEMYYNYKGDNIIKVNDWHWLNENGTSIKRDRDLEGEWINSKDIRRVPATFKYIYKYDIDGNKTEENVYINNNNEFAAKKIWNYDKLGNLIEETFIDSMGESYTTKTIEYEDNLKIREYRYNSEGKKTVQYTWNYDKKGNMLQEINQVNDKIFEHGWVYDKNNNVIEEYVRGDYGGWKKVLKYDSLNNWIEETNFNKNNIPTSQKQRIIEYY
jgi:hypothetical protein